MDISTSAARSRVLLGATIAIGVIALATIAWLVLGRGPAEASASARAGAAVDKEVAKLDLPRRTTELASEKALRARDAIEHGDYTTARRIVAAVLADSRLQSWRYYPFGDFINELSDLGNPAFERRLNEWVTQNKDDSIPRLIRAQYYFDLGWLTRGHSFRKYVQQDHLAAFQADMGKALADVDAAIGLNGHNPYSFYLRLRILHGSGMSPDLRRAFLEAVEKYPSYYKIYEIYLVTLEPRWGGSIAAMYGFVNLYAGNADRYSPLKMLYLDLYRKLLDFASTRCAAYWSDRSKVPQCVMLAMKSIVTRDLTAQVSAALQLYDHSDRSQFDALVEGMLVDTLKTEGGDAESGALLELAASSMHSDTRLNEESPGHNDYAIDLAVSESWYLKGFYDNALKKNKEALEDIKYMKFPSKEEKDAAVAEIYSYMSGIYNKLNQYVDMVAYEKAAVALGGPRLDEDFICYGYFKLKAYDLAVRACTTALKDETGNLQIRYWRAKAYQGLGKANAALQDLTTVAESENGFRYWAAIDISMIYFDRNDIEGALRVLNRYTYLYDPNLNNKEGLAVSYNNRCYAYMQLGELTRALADCTKSLKYGSLPDAYRKQQELLKRLARPGGADDKLGGPAT